MVAIHRVNAHGFVPGRFVGQVASAPLMVPEQFALGGPDSVRGYQQSEFLGDYGYALASEFGESRAHTFHWLAGLGSLGVPHPELTADLPLFQAFQRAGRTSYVAYDPDATDRTVRFTDGTRLRVPARTLLRQGSAAPPSR